MSDSNGSAASDAGCERPWLTPLRALSAEPLKDRNPRPEAPQTPHETRYGYRIGGLGLLVGVGTTAESIESPTIYPVPRTASWFLGMINLRGSLVPVFDLHQLLQQEQIHSGTRFSVLVLDRGERAVGVRIDGLPQAVSIRAPVDADPAGAAPELLRHDVRAAFADQDRLWLDFDLDAFLRRMRAQVAA